MAYDEVVSQMKQRAAAFEFPSEGVGPAGIDPERDLLQPPSMSERLYSERLYSERLYSEQIDAFDQMLVASSRMFQYEALHQDEAITEGKDECSIVKDSLACLRNER